MCFLLYDARNGEEWRVVLKIHKLSRLTMYAAVFYLKIHDLSFLQCKQWRNVITKATCLVFRCRQWWNVINNNICLSFQIVAGQCLKTAGFQNCVLCHFSSNLGEANVFKWPAPTVLNFWARLAPSCISVFSVFLAPRCPCVMHHDLIIFN